MKALSHTTLEVRTGAQITRTRTHSIRKTLAILATAVSLACAGTSEAALNIAAWSDEAANIGTTPNSLINTPVQTATRPTVDLSGLAGATQASYEFIVNVPTLSQFSPFLLSDNDWGLVFDNESVLGGMRDELGTVDLGVANYFFTPGNGASLASPYDRDAHLVFTYDGSDTRLYLDGVLIGIMPALGHVYSRVATDLGFVRFLNDTLHNINGTVFGFVSYASSLSDGEVADHAAASLKVLHHAGFQTT